MVLFFFASCVHFSTGTPPWAFKVSTATKENLEHTTMLFLLTVMDTEDVVMIYIDTFCVLFTLLRTILDPSLLIDNLSLTKDDRPSVNFPCNEIPKLTRQIATSETRHHRTT